MPRVASCLAPRDGRLRYTAKHTLMGDIHICHGLLEKSHDSINVPPSRDPGENFHEHS